MKARSDAKKAPAREVRAQAQGAQGAAPLGAAPKQGCHFHPLQCQEGFGAREARPGLAACQWVTSWVRIRAAPEGHLRP